MKKICIFIVMIFLTPFAYAQVLDDIVERKILNERNILAYQPLREADLFWEKRIWRVIDTREKMNHPFIFAENPFFNILQNAAENRNITLYSGEDDKFTYPLDSLEFNGLLYTLDTFEVFHPDTEMPKLVVVKNDFNYEDVKRFRIKETWFFDEATSTMKIRIIGIAPLMEVRGENGNFRYEKPLFWVYFPELRQVLAREKVFNPYNDSSLISWDDLLEMRLFSSYIYKQSNVRNDRLKDIYTGVDLLLEAEKIKQEIFNFEHDLWSY